MESQGLLDHHRVDRAGVGIGRAVPDADWHCGPEHIQDEAVGRRVGHLDTLDSRIGNADEKLKILKWIQQ